MQVHPNISLNAVRVFVLTAKHSSISRAAIELNVSPSAVSHQIKNLEESLGAPLFSRSNNSIDLTEVGIQFYDEASIGIQVIERSIQDLNRDSNEIFLTIAMSFAVRWLIPALEDFKKKFPSAKIHLDTFVHQMPASSNSSDITISYNRVTDSKNVGDVVLKDNSRPVVSPNLLEKCAYNSLDDLFRIPALSCTPDNWDWLYWQDEMCIETGSINFTHSLDSDDAAIHAAVAGLGMVLATPLATRGEIRAGTLIEVPYCKPLFTGYYYVNTGVRKTRLIDEFKNWLTVSLSDQE